MTALAFALTLLSAAPTKGVVTTSPPVLVLQTGVNPETTRREQRLFEALGLVLDDFSVLMTPPPTADFAKRTLPDQIASVLPDAQKEGAVAVIWLTIPAPEQLMLNLVAIGTGRTLVRTVEVAKGPNAERTLAMMLRELLGTAYLFETVNGLSPAIRRVVESITAQVAPEPVAHASPKVPVQVAPSSRETIALTAQLLAVSGVAGQLGDSFRPGLEPSIDFHLGDFWLGAHLSLLVGPFSGAPASLSGLDLAGGAHVYYPLRAGRALVGPLLGADVGWTHIAATGTTTNLTRFFGRWGVLGRMLVANDLELSASLIMLASPVRLELQSLSDSGPQVIYREGAVQVRLGLGLTLPL